LDDRGPDFFPFSGQKGDADPNVLAGPSIDPIEDE